MGFVRNVLVAIKWIAAVYTAVLLLLLIVWLIAAVLGAFGVPGM